MATYQPPAWAGEFPAGWHLDVQKDDALVQKVGLEGRPALVFGRNEDTCQVILAHPSASRQHAALVYHSAAERAFLSDLGSTHGTFLGPRRLDPNQLTPVAEGSMLRFGASTRTYVLHTAPPAADDVAGITAFNAMQAAVPQTNQNKHPASPTEEGPAQKRPRKSVRFEEEPIVHAAQPLSPEGGRYAGLVTSTVLVAPPTSKAVGLARGSSKGQAALRRQQLSRAAPLGGLFAPVFVPKAASRPAEPPPSTPTAPASSTAATTPTPHPVTTATSRGEEPAPAGKRKYAKEAWIRNKMPDQDEED